MMTRLQEKPVKRTYYGQDITGNEDDSVFRKLKDCFQMITMVNGQDSTTKDIQLLRYIDICSGTSSTELLWLNIKTTGRRKFRSETSDNMDS